MNDSLHPSGIRFSSAARSSPSAPVLVTLVHHDGSGRIRVRVRGLYRSEAMKHALEALAWESFLFLAVEANPLTGNAVIRFAPGQPVALIVAELETRARFHSPGAPPKPRFVAKPAKPPGPEGDSPGLPQRFGLSLPAFRRAAKAGEKPLGGGHGEAPPRQAWHAAEIDPVLDILETRREGLTGTQPLDRLDRFGPNALDVQKPRSAWAMVAGQILNPPVALLGLSAAVSIATGGVADALVILSVVAINAAIGYATESSAEKIIGSLGKMTPARALVVRDGRSGQIPLKEVVPGDILVLEPGSHVPADGRLISSNRLTVDESALTGESLPVGKHHGFVAAKDTPLADRRNMVYRGTVVTGGSGHAVAVATGGHTEIGAIQSLVGEVKPPETPLQRQLNDMGTQLALLSGGICAAMFGLGLLRGFGWLPMLKSSISLAVAAVPEGLPAVATTTLALGIREMQRRKVLVRQLSAVEGLGSIQTLCLDKTGTLTENRMRAVGLELIGDSVLLTGGGFWSGRQPIAPLEREDLKRLLEAVCLCSEVRLVESGEGMKLDGSPTESALVEIALEAGADIKGLRKRHPLVRTVHRAEDRPYMVTVHRNPDEGHYVAVKGSPAEVLGLCTRCIRPDGSLTELGEEERAAILGRNEAMAGQALRVLGVAYGYSGEVPAAVIRNLVWLGLAGMEDTIRAGMDELMRKFHDAGIDTVMITGDQSATAFSVGRRLGLNNGDKPLEIIDSASLEKLDPDVLSGIATGTSVFARVSPAHKLRIVQALQKSGRVVAMTGDGINDGPALRAADVGVALGEHGAEVARSVADVVLEDDNLHTMVAAVEQGRTIYANIRKSLRFLLSTNLSEIEIMLIGIGAGAGEVLNPIQLLWINLISDILPGLGLALEQPERNVLKQPPRDPKEAIVGRADAYRMVRESLVLTAGTLGVYGYSLARYGRSPRAGTNAFMTVTLGQLLYALSCRSERASVFHPVRRPPNRFLNLALIGSAALQVAAAYVPPFRALLRLSPIGPADWLAIAAGATVPFVVNEGTKLRELQAGHQQVDMVKARRPRGEAGHGGKPFPDEVCP
jgi:Ca2+-transporting ATPase